MCIAIYVALIALLLIYSDFVVEQYGLATLPPGDGAPMVVAIGWEMIAPLWPMLAVGAVAGSALTALVLRKGRSCAGGACTAPPEPADRAQER